MTKLSRIQHWKLDRLKPYEFNARRHPEQQVKRIAASIQEFGFNAPILVAEDGEIIYGHGRLLAAKHLGLDKVPVIVAHEMTEQQRIAYRIADNKLTDIGGWDTRLLEDELQKINADKLLSGVGHAMGFGPKYLEKITGKSSDQSSGDHDVQPIYEVVITCDSEAEQERYFNELTQRGAKCRVLTL